jgi:phytoene dehydrogenase-like protein
VFKVDFAVEGAVPWRHEPSRHAGTVHLAGGYEEVALAEREVARGRMPARPFVLVGQQYLADPSRSLGTTHPLYAYAHVPAGYSGDATAAIEEQTERFAPGFRERILARHIRSTAQMEAHNANYVGGDVVTGANSARQLVFRPRAATDPYSLGVPGCLPVLGRDAAWRRRPRNVRVQRGPRGPRAAAVAQPAAAARVTQGAAFRCRRGR